MMSRNLDSAEDAMTGLKKALEQEKSNNKEMKKQLEAARREREQYDLRSITRSKILLDCSHCSIL